MNNLSLDQYIGVYKNAIPKHLCQSLEQDSDNFSWLEFGWTTQERYQKVKKSKIDEPQIDTCETVPPKYKLQLNPIIENCVEQYKINYAPLLKSIMGFTQIKINRYNVNLGLAKHIDHIHSIFDGQRKGIPTFSIVGLLNDNFEGGNFIFWDDYVAPFEIGTIIIFPSNFLYPHRVDKITKGKRLSLVSWVW